MTATSQVRPLIPNHLNVRIPTQRKLTIFSGYGIGHVAPPVCVLRPMKCRPGENVPKDNLLGLAIRDVGVIGFNFKGLVLKEQDLQALKSSIGCIPRISPGAPSATHGSSYGPLKDSSLCGAPSGLPILVWGVCWYVRQGCDMFCIKRLTAQAMIT